MLYRLSLVSLMVSILLGTAVGSVTTAAAQTTATAPGQCEWPVAGNVLAGDGTFPTDTHTGWYTYNSAQRVAITGHPCGYTFGYSEGGPELQGNVFQTPDKWLLVSYWIYVEPTYSAYVYASRRFPWAGVYETEAAITIPGNEWYFHTTCLPPSTQEGETSFTVMPSGGGTSGDLKRITGISARVGDSCDVSAAPPPDPTAVPTATYTPDPTAVPPDPTAVPTATPTATPTQTPTPIVTLTPFAMPTPLPEISATAVPTLPRMIMDLPSLPGPLPINAPPVDMQDMPMPDIGMEDGIFIIQVTRTVTSGLAESEAWTMIRYLAYIFLSVTLLGKLIF